MHKIIRHTWYRGKEGFYVECSYCGRKYFITKFEYYRTEYCKKCFGKQKHQKYLDKISKDYLDKDMGTYTIVKIYNDCIDCKCNICGLIRKRNIYSTLFDKRNRKFKCHNNCTLIKTIDPNDIVGKINKTMKVVRYVGYTYERKHDAVHWYDLECIQCGYKKLHVRRNSVMRGVKCKCSYQYKNKLNKQQIEELLS